MTPRQTRGRERVIRRLWLPAGSTCPLTARGPRSGPARARRAAAPVSRRAADDPGRAAAAG